ncbi:fec operon regulator FecR [Serratia liquefaciens]|uniref:ferric citrate uptake sigma factor regulator FecR n=1 Tax=Serratia liquefaciens TaxID=614 RepID=UPI000959244C|nr:ferric citrate uptake sigma factor regulator FecR [Serratia liquefaciens]OKP21309.1 iron dicitrate transport regulator FecR [Serratia liquefaciens]CAI2437854.1 fec operon regulator FecR [Serratia liquefaciens]HEJ8021864.1 fec operon regulator FecR [Serratia liquefaciens]HEJ8025452.1 fec operon regulator FecR [Serratia liquefaciens]HEJ8087724.1 fec operon regulator FecR [Serratia liquefaciens]
MSHTLTPEQRQALKMAAQWFALLCDENVTEHQRQQWQAWHQQNEDHRWAWQRVEALQSQLQGVPGKFSYRTLDQAGRQSTLDRRTLLKSLLLLLGVGGSWLGFQSPLGRELRADYRTATGEIKPIVLSDGSQLVLNTASAVDVRYSAEKRLILLHSGEISLITGRDDRPFWVESRQGAMRALGTHFLVRENDDQTQLTVLEHAVEAQLAQFPQEKRRINAGEQISFSAVAFGQQQAAGNGDSWTRGVLSVSQWRLDQVLAELARYRHGRLDCDPAIAGLRVSGSFPLREPDRALLLLSQTLPIRLQSFTRYWLKVVPA